MSAVGADTQTLAVAGRMAVDLGTGLERLAWARTRMNWHRLVYGRFARAAPTGTLDAIRTATLLIGHGITPAARGPGGITRRVVGTISPDAVPLGVSAFVRTSYDYWSLFGPLSVSWPAVVAAIEKELLLYSDARGKLSRSAGRHP